jgi:hypothetical protein
MKKANPVRERPLSQPIYHRTGKHMKHLSKAEIAIIKARIIRGDLYVNIASDYRINQGRIADLKFGRIYANIEPADISDREA